MEMTNNELAKKYGVGDGTMKLAISLGQVKPVRKTGMKNHYDEEEAAAALMKLYRLRKEGHLNHAAAWHCEMIAVERILREGGERTDYINPVNGPLALEGRMKREMEEVMK